MVKRLVYAPRAFAFVHSEAMGKIIDVSDDIVSGWVDRVDNDMSKAELVLRNVGRKYITYADDKGDRRPVFAWDDLITIWLQRLPGQPVQVFTGYLDSVPGWQMFPGDCRISASCTMKRLAHTWFDPGSSFFTAMASQRGWAYNPDSGQGWQPDIYGATADPENPDALPATDGGMSGFLFHFLTEIGGWDKSMVMIGELDPNLLDKANELKAEQVSALQEDMNGFKEVMRRFIGFDQIDVTTVGGVTPDGQVNADITRKVEAIQKELGPSSRIPLSFAVFAAIARSQMNPSYQRAPETGDDIAGVGLFRFQQAFVLDESDSTFESSIVSGNGHYETDIYGRPASAYVGNLPVAMNAFKGLFNGYINRSYSGEAPTSEQWASLTEDLETDSRRAATVLDVMGIGVSDATAIRAFDEANRYITGVIGGQAVAQPEGTTEREIIVLDWDSEELLALPFDPDELANLAKYGTHHPSLIPYLYFVKKEKGESVKLEYPDGIHKESLYLSGEINAVSESAQSNNLTGSLYDLYKKFAGHDEVSSVKVIADSESHSEHMREGEPGGVGGGAAMLASNAIRIVMNEETVDPPPDWVGLPTEVNTDDNVLGRDERGFSVQQLGQFSTISALQSQYTFAALDGVAGSLLLTNNRALMNDISCLDASKQLAQGSMRNLMSLPNGRLCAYYPDYFGARRGPYWYIREIEIINMGVQLSDAPLATHVYVTGDTTGPSYAGDINISDRIFSQGVVTVFDVELLNAFIVPGTITQTVEDGEAGPTSAFDATKAESFCNKHGMRVLREENPIIKNPWYEFLMAWQRFMQQWAATFDTRVEFTFQPEIMAGGIIGLKEHGLQMYCKQVRHDFSYEGGFSTTATMTSPAVLYNPKNPTVTPPLSLPGMVIAGGVNTVGFS